MAVKKNDDTEETTKVTQTTETTEVAAEVVGSAVNTEHTYKLSALQKHCRALFGVSTTTFVGATAGIEDKPYTVNQIKSIIQTWCRKEVK